MGCHLSRDFVYFHNTIYNAIGVINSYISVFEEQTSPKIRS